MNRLKDRSMSENVYEVLDELTCKQTDRPLSTKEAFSKQHVERLWQLM